jgi:hypothetical protein
MKLFLDLKNRRFVKSAASNVALDRLVLKRRDTLPIEVVYVENGALATPPAGTTAAVGLKAKFSDSNFLAYAAPGQTILDLNTLPVEAAFSLNPATVSALLEIRWGAPGTAHRTATLAVELQNSVITGDEATPAAIPDGKATQAEAEAGTDNAKWMTPLRTAQAIAELAPPPTWDSVLNKPATFPATAHTHLKSEITGLNADLAALSAADTALDARIDHLAANLDPAALDSIAEAAASINSLQNQLDTHTHTAADITDFASAVVAVSPPVDWSSLTGKPATFAPSAHNHTIAEVTGLTDSLAGKATAAQGALADTALQPEAADYRGAYDNGADYWPGQVVSYNGELYIRTGEPNTGYPPGSSYWAAFDPSASPAFKLWVELSKADTIHTHAAAEITGLSSYIIASAPGLSITTTVHTATGATDTYSVGGLASSDPAHVLVQLNGVTQTPVTDYLIDFPNGLIIFDGIPTSGTQIALTALGLRTVQPPIDPALYRYASDTSSDGLTNYYGRIANTDYTGTASASSPVWTIHRTTFDLAGRVVSTGSATSVAWANRTTATYTATP